MATEPGVTRRAMLIRECVRSARRRQLILDAVTSFEIYRSDTGDVLAFGVQGFKAARERANDLRMSLGLKWDLVKVRVEKNQGAGAFCGRGCLIDQSP